MSAMPYWYNVKNGTVENDENRSPSNDLLGPFASEGEARDALATSDAHRRAAEASDRAWDQNPEEVE